MSQECMNYNYNYNYNVTAVNSKHLIFRLLIFVTITIFNSNLRFAVKSQLSQIIQHKYNLIQHL